jgi:hypothetical protein
MEPILLTPTSKKPPSEPNSMNIPLSCLRSWNSLLRSTIGDVIIWKQNNSLLHRLLDKNKIHRLIEDRLETIRRQLDKVAVSQETIVPPLQLTPRKARG